MPFHENSVLLNNIKNKETSKYIVLGSSRLCLNIQSIPQYACVCVCASKHAQIEANNIVRSYMLRGTRFQVLAFTRYNRARSKQKELNATQLPCIRTTDTAQIE